MHEAGEWGDSGSGGLANPLDRSHQNRPKEEENNRVGREDGGRVGERKQYSPWGMNWVASALDTGGSEATPKFPALHTFHLPSDPSSL